MHTRRYMTVALTLNTSIVEIIITEQLVKSHERLGLLDHKTIHIIIVFVEFKQLIKLYEYYINIL